MNALPVRQEFRWSIRKKGKHVFNICRQFVVLNSLAVGLLAGTSTLALANPTGGTVAGGSATISSAGSEVDINQSSSRVIINWGSFDIASGETTKFIQPGASSIALNRVTTSGQISTIDGSLIANGQVVIINPNGVLIGPHGNVDAAGFVASSADVNDNAFMSGASALQFDKAGSSTAVVENQGNITIENAGLGLLVAPTVKNSGVIEGNLARLQMGAGDTFGVDFYGDGLLNLAVSTSGVKRSLSAQNTGRITASGGKVLMTAAAASNVVDSVINTSGVVQATSLVSKGGVIVLTGAGAHVKVSGTVDASGKTGGGSIKIGGDTRGQSTLATADSVDVSSDATISADGIESGDGGDITLWADVRNYVSGLLTARGGANSGNGGLIETSTDGELNIDGSTIDTSAANGDYGNWLLDPRDVVIHGGTHDGDDSGSSTGTLTGGSVAAGDTPSTTFNIYESEIEGTNSNITIEARRSISTVAGGDNVVTLQNNRSLTIKTTNSLNLLPLEANNDGTIDLSNLGFQTQGSGAITITGSTGSGNSSITTALLQSASGAINVSTDAGNVTLGTVTTAGGSVTASASGDLTLGGVITTAGGGVTGTGSNINMNKDMSVGNGSISMTAVNTVTLADLADNALTAGSGSVTLKGTGSSGKVVFTDKNDKITTTTGNILVTAQSGGIDIGSLQTNDGTITLTTTNGGNIATRNLSITDTDGGFSTLNVNSAGALTITGNVFVTNLDDNDDPDYSEADASLIAQNSINVTGTITDTAKDTDQPNFDSNATLTVTSTAGNIVLGGAVDVEAYSNKNSTDGTNNPADAVAQMTANNGAITVSGGGVTVLATAINSDTDFSTTANSTLNLKAKNDINIAGGASSTATATANSKDKSNALTSIVSTNGELYFTGGADPLATAGDGKPSSNNGPDAVSQQHYIGQNVDLTNTAESGTALDTAHLILSGLHKVTVTADHKTKVYGDADPGLTYTATYDYTGAAVGAGFFSGGLSRAAGENVASYAINQGTLGHTTTSTGTYLIGYVGNTLTITPATLTVTADSFNRSYGDANPTLTGHISGFKFGQNASVVSGLTYNTAATQSSDIGDYAISGSGATAANYTFSYVNGVMHIAPVTLTVTAGDYTRGYGDANPAIGGTVTGFKLGQNDSVISGLTYGTTATQSSNIGDYATSGSGASATNYTFSYVNGNLHIDPATLTVTAGDYTRGYGDANPTIGGTVTGFKLGQNDSVISGLTYSTTATQPSDIGDYATSGAGASATNYTFSYVNGNLHIDPATLTVTAGDYARGYGDANPTIGGTVTGFKLGQDGSVISGLTYSTTATQSSDVGDYATSGSGASAANYTISYVDGNLHINPATLTVTAGDYTRGYGDANPTIDGTVTGFKLGQDGSVISGLSYGTDATQASNVGDYATYGSGATATNYTFSYVNGNLHIDPASLTVTAGDYTRGYGDANPTIGGTVTGFKLGQDESVISGLTYGTTATQSSDIGNYATYGSGGEAANYTISYVNGNLHIDPATLTVTAGDYTRDYGDANPTIGGTVTGFKLGQDDSVISGLSYSTTATQASDVGDYATSGSGASAENYTFSYVDGNLHIGQATLTVTAGDYTRGYGDANPTIGGTVTGFKLGQDDSVISGLTYGTTATQSSDVGDYATSGSGGTAANYTISYVDGNLHINPATLTVTAGDYTRGYGDANPTIGGTVTGFKLGQDDSVISGLAYSTTATLSSDVGDYATSGSGASATNYTFSYVDGNLHINPASLTVTAGDYTRGYGDANPTIGGTVTGFKLGQDDSVISGLSYGTTATQSSDIGDYATSGSGASATNYTFSYVDGNLHIDPATLTVTAGDYSRTYGAANPTIGGTVTGFKLGQDDSVISGLSYSTTATQASNVGDYATSGAGASASNYVFSYVDGTLHVTPASLVITANDQTKAFGSTFTFTGNEFGASGLVNGDSVSGVELASGGAPSSAKPGDYDISVDGATGSGLSNYDISYVPGNMTVTEPPAEAPFIQIDPLGRPIISVADQVLVYNPPFEQIETLTLDTDVSIKLPPQTASSGGGGDAGSAMANIEPAAGGDDDGHSKKKKKGKTMAQIAQDLANVEPAAGGNGPGGAPAAGGDVGCANDFLDNKSCPVQ